MSLYLDRYAFYKSELINQKPNDNLFLSIVIPCFNEPSITETLKSIAECSAPQLSFEIIIVVNNSEIANEEIIKQNHRSINEINSFKAENKDLKIYILKELKLPKKHAGVGLARKIGMDEAVRRNPDGIIICLDADSLVNTNYLTEIENHFLTNKTTNGCGIHFEHPTSGELNNEIYNGIIAYELHLRYFINAQKWAEHPHAYQTIGSSMAVRSKTYEKVGGMPKKQAGEDFYFLQKVIQLGSFTEIKTTKVIPSPRISDRVPFGTGKAVRDYINQKQESLSYNFNIFIDLKNTISQIENIYQEDFSQLPKSFNSFWSLYGFEEIKKINQRSPNINVFRKNFFNWFNAFQVMKYVHFSRDNYYPNEKLTKCCHNLLDNKTLKTELELLEYFRELDRQN